MLKLHGVPLSQPFRAVAWACLQKRLPFAVQVVIPGSTGKGGSREDKFLGLNPTGNVPFVEDGTVALPEAAAILTYLSSAHDWSDLYPTDLPRRAAVDSYLSWHQNNTRLCSSGFFAPNVRPDIAAALGADGIARAEKGARAALSTVDSHWLGGAPFLAGADAPTVADLLAYEEIVQLAPAYGNLLDLTPYPHIGSWLERMAALPYHEEAHAASAALGDLGMPNETPMPKRLSAATKAGLVALAGAQPA